MNRILLHDPNNDHGDNLKLRQKAKRVKNPQSTEAILCVQAMKRLALDWEQRNPGQLCAGLAAPQIGVPLRIVIIRSQDVERAPQDPDRLTIEQARELYGEGVGVYGPDAPTLTLEEYNAGAAEIASANVKYNEAALAYREWKNGPGANYDPFLVMYNPVYHESEGMQDSDEGCLSVPYAEGETMRPEKSTFHYYDQNLRRVPQEGYLLAEGLSSSVVCHELDHLNGILFCDSALKLWRPGSKPKVEEPVEETVPA